MPIEIHPPAASLIKVLVIEDDTLTRITLCKIFTKLNYRTVEACNGMMGMKMFRQEKPDIVLTDLLMPDKEGLETISEIRALNPDVRIIAMSGGGSMHNLNFLDLARKMGADYTLPKPFQPMDILSLLNIIKG